MSQTISNVSGSSATSKLSSKNQNVSSTAAVNPQAFQLLVDQFMNSTINSLAQMGSSESDSSSTNSTSVNLNSLLGLTTNSSSNATSTGTASAANSRLSAQNQGALGANAYNAEYYQLLSAQFMNNAIGSLAKIGSTDYSNSSSNSSSTSNGSDLNLNSLLGFNDTNITADVSSELSAQLQKLQSLNTYASLVNSANPTAASYIDTDTGKLTVGVIQSVDVDANGNVTFLINDQQIPLAYIKGVTRYDEDAEA